MIKESIVISGFSTTLLQYLAGTPEALLDVRFTSTRQSFYVQHLALDLVSKVCILIKYSRKITSIFCNNLDHIFLKGYYRCFIPDGKNDCYCT